MINDSAEPTQLPILRKKSQFNTCIKKKSLNPNTEKVALYLVSRTCNITEGPEIRPVPEHAGLRAGVRLQPLSSSRQAYVIVSFFFCSGLFFALSSRLS